jgi:hypothetical protein
MSILVGNPSALAIESGITQVFDRASQRALGYFLIHVGGRCFGVRAPDATLLACSFDSVKRRIANRGKHHSIFTDERSSLEIVDAVQAVEYDENRQGERFLGFSASDIQVSLRVNENIWAPDGDAAFDDGGHVLHLDFGDSVRLIAFRNTGTRDEILGSVAESRLLAEDFYEILRSWQDQFEAECSRLDHSKE